MPTVRSRHSTGPWLTIRDASALVGVSEATLRRWTEAGDVEVFLTPGGHRRFTRAGLATLLPGPARPPRTLRELGETPERAVRQVRRDIAGGPRAEWFDRLDEPGREAFRELGRRILIAVLAHLDLPAGDDDVFDLDEARAAAADHGRLAAELGLDSVETTRAFVRYRRTFLDELATTVRRRRLEASRAIGVIIAATSVFDDLLLDLLRGRARAASSRAARTPGGSVAATATAEELR